MESKILKGFVQILLIIAFCFCCSLYYLWKIDDNQKELKLGCLDHDPKVKTQLCKKLFSI